MLLRFEQNGEKMLDLWIVHEWVTWLQNKHVQRGALILKMPWIAKTELNFLIMIIFDWLWCKIRGSSIIDSKNVKNYIKIIYHIFFLVTLKEQALIVNNVVGLFTIENINFSFCSTKTLVMKSGQPLWRASSSSFFHPLWLNRSVRVYFFSFWFGVYKPFETISWRNVR